MNILDLHAYFEKVEEKRQEFDYARIGETSSSLSSTSHQICFDRIM